MSPSVPNVDPGAPIETGSEIKRFSCDISIGTAQIDMEDDCTEEQSLLHAEEGRSEESKTASTTGKEEGSYARPWYLPKSAKLSMALSVRSSKYLCCITNFRCLCHETNISSTPLATRQRSLR